MTSVGSTCYCASRPSRQARLGIFITREFTSRHKRGERNAREGGRSRGGILSPTGAARGAELMAQIMRTRCNKVEARGSAVTGRY